jgi:transcriptional regulator with XRE-family HTH domain
MYYMIPLEDFVTEFPSTGGSGDIPQMREMVLDLFPIKECALITACIAGTLGHITAESLLRLSATANCELRLIEPERADSGVHDHLDSRTCAENLARIREMFSTSVTELANLFGVSRQAIYDWQAGKGVADHHAEKLAALAKAADVIATCEHQILRPLRRKLPGGKTLFDIVRDGGSAESAARVLVDMTEREITQRQALEARLLRHNLPGIDHNDMGLPMLSERD